MRINAQLGPLFLTLSTLLSPTSCFLAPPRLATIKPSELKCSHDDPSHLREQPQTAPAAAPAAALALSLMLNLAVSSPASAAVAPLADVGLREFLVKDSGALLRLSLPSSMSAASPMDLPNDAGR